MLDTIERLESNVRGYVRKYPTVFETARGATLYATDGRSYIDFFAGAGTLNYGHNPPCVKQALLDYIARDGVQHGLDMATLAKVEFLRAFDEIILRPRRMDYKVQFTGPTGANAIEAAVKLARKIKQRSHVVAFTNGYHGHSLGALALTGNRYYHQEYYGSHNNVSHLPYDSYIPGVDSVQVLERMLDDTSSGLPVPAAVIFETVQCEGGINAASPHWVRRIVDLCRQRDILVIVDDIQTGNGRTGPFFSFEEAGVEPDLVCLSKAIGGGLPFSLVLIRSPLDRWQPGEHTGTFRGNNLAFVAARAVLENWRTQDLSQHVLRLGQKVEASLQNLAECHAPRGFSVRGRGLVWGLDLRGADLAARVIQESFERGLIVETAGANDDVVKIMPPLVIDEATLTSGLGILAEAIQVACPEKLASCANVTSITVSGDWTSLAPAPLNNC